MPAGGWRIDWGREFDVHEDRAQSSPLSGRAAAAGGKAHPPVHQRLRRAHLPPECPGRGARAAPARDEASQGSRATPTAAAAARGTAAAGARHRARAGWNLRSTSTGPASGRSPERERRADADRGDTAAGNSSHPQRALLLPQRVEPGPRRLPRRSSRPAQWPTSSGLLNSLVLDFVVRRKVGTHVTKSVMSTVPIADVPLDSGPGAEHRSPVSPAHLPEPGVRRTRRGARLRVRPAGTERGAGAARGARRAGRPPLRPVGCPAGPGTGGLPAERGHRRQPGPSRRRLQGHWSAASSPALAAMRGDAPAA